MAAGPEFSRDDVKKFRLKEYLQKREEAFQGLPLELRQELQPWLATQARHKDTIDRQAKMGDFSRAIKVLDADREKIRELKVRFRGQRFMEALESLSEAAHELKEALE